MARLKPDDQVAKDIDDALSSWRQGDVALDAGWFVHIADGAAALTAEGGEGLNVIQTTAEGVVVLTQSCDILKKCCKQPFIEVAPLVEVEDRTLHEIERGYRPNYALVPALQSRRLVADLDRVMTVEKSIVANWTHGGWVHDRC